MLKEGFELLKKYEIPIADYWVNTIPENPEFPLVIKADILHKTDANAIKLNIKDKETLVKYFEEFKERFPNNDIIIQKQIEGNYLEIIIGAKRDPIFDYFILIGIGGIFTEIIKDFIIIIPPILKEKFIELLKELKLSNILFGYRNLPPINIDLLYDVINKISRIMENEKIDEIEINPLMINDKECFAVDVRFK